MQASDARQRGGLAARGARAADNADWVPQRRLTFFLWPPQKVRQAGLR
jgi:hypothetical protein